MKYKQKNQGQNSANKSLRDTEAANTLDLPRTEVGRARRPKT